MHLEALKQEERFHLRFSSLNYKEKGINNVFGSYNVTSKLWLLYLEVKLQQHRWNSCI